MQYIIKNKTKKNPPSYVDLKQPATILWIQTKHCHHTKPVHSSLFSFVSISPCMTEVELAPCLDSLGGDGQR